MKASCIGLLIDPENDERFIGRSRNAWSIRRRESNMRWSFNRFPPWDDHTIRALSGHGNIARTNCLTEFTRFCFLHLLFFHARNSALALSSLVLVVFFARLALSALLCFSSKSGGSRASNEASNASIASPKRVLAMDAKTDGRNPKSEPTRCNIYTHSNVQTCRGIIKLDLHLRIQIERTKSADPLVGPFRILMF